MTEIDISAKTVGMVARYLDEALLAASHRFGGGDLLSLEASMLRALRDALTAAEAERDALKLAVRIERRAKEEALGQVLALREAAEVWAVSDSDLFLALQDTAAAAREYRERIVEQCAEIAGSAKNGTEAEDQIFWLGFKNGVAQASAAVRAHAAKIREGLE